MKNLKDLFEHQLKDLYSAETQLLKALPKMAENASDAKLKKAFEAHLKETETHQHAWPKFVRNSKLNQPVKPAKQ